MRYAALILWALVLVFTVSAVGRAQDAAPAAAPPQRWEFQWVPWAGVRGLDAANAAGKEGWELICIAEGKYYMKRPVK